ncbi:MAG: DUF1553 domain-containing protein, partial [Planctomycetaceae bacterium]|nr:DUF1553 domain-containing protein [Planctomycetaceae bacterium]
AALWSFQTPVRPSVPVGHANPIDAFISVRLKAKGLSPAPAADRRTLIRRATFDLHGLPPTPDQIATFVSDTRPGAYERLIDRLLQSPRYGEHWGKHWLDLVRYGDTSGFEQDPYLLYAWRYRDYVIRSFNEDKPFDRFVQEQIAGDMLFPDSEDGVLGLGFLAAGPWDFIGHVEVPESKIDGQEARNLDRDDMVCNTLNTFCSVTIQCARCHNHKFDPLTQANYYGLQAVFAAVDRADRPYGTSAEQERQREELVTQIKELRELLRTATDPATLKVQLTQAEDNLRALPPRHLVYAAATHFAPQGQFKPTQGVPRTIRILHRGNVLQPGEDARPQAVPLGKNFDAHLPVAEGDAEGERRAALARWITRIDHPLTWRSIVNRIWQYHFGRGLVETPNDFGRMGQSPSHPELLDWLAVEFRDNGQSWKQLHRLIVTSAVYRQASTGNEANARIDGENRLLWRASRRRLEAEEIRDTILAASGRLNDRMGGPGYYLFELERTEHSPHYEYHKFDPDDPQSHRRAVYRFIVRSQPDPYMTTLDCADSSQSTPRRDETLTSLQALSMLNSRFHLSSAAAFATRLESESDTLDGQVVRGLELLIGRSPTRHEQQRLVEYASVHGLPNFCRLLFNLSEMIYID